MKKRVNRNINIFTFLEMACGHIIGYIIYIRHHTDVIAGNAFWKAGRSTGIQNVGEVFPGIQVNLGFQWWTIQKFFKCKHPLAPLHLAGGYFIKKDAEISLPSRQKINQICNNDAFEPGIGKHFFGVTEIGVLTDDGFRPRILDHIIEFV